jgi:antitoxin component of MazEF toxin-antitoxin module
MAGLAEGDEVAIHAEDGRIVLRRTVRRYALEELIEGISAENRHDEKTWGGPAGAEAW